VSGAFPILWVHVLAAVCWVGGQLFLILVVMPVLGQELAESERVRVASLVGKRFAALSGVVLGLLLFTGLLNAAEHGVSWSILRDTTWGRVLIAKMCAVVLMLALTVVSSSWAEQRARTRRRPGAAARSSSKAIASPSSTCC
jgi:putative copper export protein